MTSDSEFVAFINHTIQMSIDLTQYANIWAVLSFLLEMQDVNATCVNVMHDYYYHCYNMRTQYYMIELEAEAD